MIDLLWSQCSICTSICCSYRNVDMHTPVLNSDITDLIVKDYIASRTDTLIVTKHGLEIEYWPIDGQTWGRIRREGNHCMAFKDGKCLIHDMWRPIICIVYPFFPVWNPNGTGFVPLIHKDCKPMRDVVDNMSSEERELLKDDIIKMWAQYEQYRIVSILYYGEAFSRKFYI